MSRGGKKEQVEFWQNYIGPLGTPGSEKWAGGWIAGHGETFMRTLSARAEQIALEFKEREETEWMLRLETGYDTNHQKEHSESRDVACRFCRLEIYTEEQDRKRNEERAKQDRKREFIAALIPVELADCCATCEHYYPPSESHGEPMECDKHDISDGVDDGYAVKCKD